MKKINIVLAVLLTALVLGFASCKQAKDVNIVSEPTNEHDLRYDISGTATQSGTSYTLKGEARFYWWDNNKDTNIVDLDPWGNNFVYGEAYDASNNYVDSVDEDVLDLSPLVKLNGKISTTKTTNGETKYVDISDRFSNGSIGDSSFTYTYTEPTTNFTFVLTFTKF